MRVQNHPIHPALAPFVKCIWSLDSEGKICDAPRERILPDACVELVFHYRDPFRSYFADGTNALQPHSLVVGQMKRFLEIEPAGRGGFVAVRLLARGAYLFFHRPLSEVAAGVVDLEHLWREDASELTERVALARCMPERLKLIEEALLRSLQNGRIEPAVDRVVENLSSRDSHATVAQVASEMGVSCRQLRRQFLHSIGLSPKEFMRVNRFLRSLQLLGAGRRQSLTQIAVDCGYFDHAHFDHEFREFAGMSPRELATFPIPVAF